MSSGITDYSLVYHLQNAKAHGVSKEEIAEIITHVGMYVGWPKAWAVFRLAKDVWNEEAAAADAKEKYQSSIFFPHRCTERCLQELFHRAKLSCPGVNGSDPRL